jgi:hypothetical protein
VGAGQLAGLTVPRVTATQAGSLDRAQAADKAARRAARAAMLQAMVVTPRPPEYPLWQLSTSELHALASYQSHMALAMRDHYMNRTQ